MITVLPSHLPTESKLPVCRCCGSSQTAYVGQKRGEVLDRQFQYYRCADCGFLFVSPFLGPEIYNDDYYRGKGPDPFVDYEREYQSYRTTDRILEFNDLVRLAEKNLLADTVGGQIRWFDFGCGSGGLLKFLRDRGACRVGERVLPLKISGHDVGVWADRLRDKDGFEIFDFTQLNSIPDGSFDVISMVEVLEHIPHPQEVISLAARLLAPGGFLLLTTGNLNCAAARKDGLNYRYCMSEIHISLLNPGCLELLYQRAGLLPVKVNYKGVVAFKVVKSVTPAWTKPLARLLVQVPVILKLIDRRYGVSAMPCARKPLLAKT